MVLKLESAISVQIYTGSADKTLRIWHMENGQVSIPQLKHNVDFWILATSSKRYAGCL